MNMLKKMSLVMGLFAIPAFAAPDSIGIHVGGIHVGIGGRPAECTAINRRGETFTAVGHDHHEAKERALNQCYAYSRDCHISYCR